MTKLDSTCEAPPDVGGTDAKSSGGAEQKCELLKSSSTSRRDERIDFWRGLCIFGMISWHLLTHPVYPRAVAFPVIQGFNFVAEGFVFLAGMSVGLLYILGRCPATRMMRRSGQILLIHYAIAIPIGLYLLLVESSPGMADIGDRLLSTLALRYQPYLGDVLSLFVFLFLLSPLLLLIARTGGFKRLWVLSLVIFLAVNWLPGTGSGGWRSWAEPNSHGAFDVLTWQFVFVSGVLLGQWWGRPDSVPGKQSVAVLVASALTWLVIAIWRFWIESDPALAISVPSWLKFSRSPLSVARAAYVGAQMALIGFLTVRIWEHLRHLAISRFFTRLGRNSLLAFTVSVFLDYALKLCLNGSSTSPLLCVLLWAAEMGMVFVIISYVEEGRKRRIPTELRGMIHLPQSPG